MAPDPIRKIPLDSIIVRPQVRRRFTADGIESLAATFGDEGMEQPIIVFAEGGQTILKSGERRLRAARVAGMDTVPAWFVARPVDEAAVVTAQLVENLARESLTPIETAEGLDRLLKLSKCTHSELAKRIGLSNATVTRLLALLELPAEIRDQIHTGRISASAGYKLSQIEDCDRQAALASQVASGDLTRDGVSTADKAKSKSRPSKSGRNARPKRHSVQVSDGLSVTVVESAASLQQLVDDLVRFVERARDAVAEGVDVETFLAGLKARLGG